MPNHHRGEIDCMIGGRRLKLCLTLGALAEIESSLGADGLAALGERLSGGRLATRDLAAIIGAAARGAGETIGDSDILALPIGCDLPSLIEAVAKLLSFTFSEEAPATKTPAPNPL